MKIKRVSDKIVKKYKMRIIHVSDTHGHLNRPYGSADCIVHSGDMLPNTTNLSRNNKAEEALFQLEWVKENIRKFKDFINGKPFLFILGNHDFCSADALEYVLRSNGIDAISLQDKVVMHEGVTFYGFPYIPYINGEWNFEMQIPEMQIKVDEMVKVINEKYVEVFVSHGSPYGILDVTHSNEHIGSTVIADAFAYKISKDLMPSYYLSGHCHENNGLSYKNNVLYSNAACSKHILEI